MDFGDGSCGANGGERGGSLGAGARGLKEIFAGLPIGGGGGDLGPPPCTTTFDIEEEKKC